MSYPDFLVTIRCMTFNQSKYIADTMNGFCIQKTNFPFICCIVDDASTDGEQEIIRLFIKNNFDFIEENEVGEQETDYAYILVGQHKKNRNCFFTVLLLKENLYSKKQDYKKLEYLKPWRDSCKYEALCEGDDYWTDPTKLQKQVDFLDSHQEYSMCFHDATEHWENGKHSDKSFSNVEDRDYTGLEIYKKWTIPTASVLIRKEAIESEYYKNLSCNPNFCYGDIILYISCAHYGKLRGMSDTMSVYRRHEGSAVFTTGLHKKFYHDYEIYRTIKGEYKETARRFLFETFRKLLQKPNISIKEKTKLFVCCFKASPIKAMYRIVRAICERKEIEM